MKVLMDHHGCVAPVKCGLFRTLQTGKTSFKLRSANHRGYDSLLLSDEGSNLVEFALMMPMLLLVLTGIFYFGMAMMNYEQLTHSVKSGANYLVTERNITSDPCADTWSAITQAAPTLDQTQLQVTITMNGVQKSGNSCQNAQSNLVQGQIVTVSAKYPCNLSGIMTFYGVFGTNCTLKASSSEYEF